MRKREKKKSSFWSDGLSVDETKISTFIILLFLFSGIAIVSVILYGDIPHNVLSLIVALVTAVAGINIAERYMTHKEDSKIPPKEDEPTI